MTVTVTEDMVSKVPVYVGYSADVNFSFIDSAGVEQSSSKRGGNVRIWLAHPYAPKIVSQPEEFFYVPAGGSAVMEVKAELPEGVPGELSYEWYDYDWANTENGAAPVAVGSTFEVSGSYYDLPVFSTVDKLYYPVVTNTYTDENGNVQKT